MAAKDYYQILGLAENATADQIKTFKVLKQGSSDLYLEYSRPLEGGEKGEWTCTVNVVVKYAER